MNPIHVNRPYRLRRNILVVALALAGTGTALAQSTTGNIFGTAPAAAGEKVRIHNTASGLVREVPVDAQGHFGAAALPIGNYTVSLVRDGQVLDTHNNVELRVGTSTQVSFATAAAAAPSEASARNLGAITVSASALPAIDVTSVDSRTVVTATQLARLPLGRNAEAVAMLAPGVVAGSPAFGSAVSFSGSSVSENAYYINGFDTSNPLTNIGGMQLPYDAIEQQEVLSGGYGAQYGRSDGGVISQVGKRGTNEWHFGAHVSWTPRSLRAESANTYYVNGDKKGQLYGRYEHNGSWDTDVSGYLSGPLIRDKLFLYAAYEAERQQGSSIGSTASPYKTQYQYHDPRWYAKLDWNINDSNILELTAASSTTSYQANQYDYDYATDTAGAFHAESAPTKNNSKMGVLKYTGYLTDNLTLSVLYGKMHQTNYTDYPGYDAGEVYISGITSQNPAIVGNSPVKGLQPFGYINAANAGNRTTNLRADLSYHLGDHTLSAGIDNQVARAIDQGSTTSGPGYWWIYHDASNDPDAPIDPANGVPSPVAYPGGATGYYVSRYSYNAMASARTVQRAQYVEDAWQVTDRLLLKLGLRNDTFTNYNVNSEAYVRQTKPQWAPRLGFAWDVNGDASFKVFGNAGRYYLALPNQVAIRAAGGSMYLNHYYTYTGINPADGTPTGLTELPPYHPVSPDGELGTAPDPTTVASKHLKSEYQDEFILGFQKQLGPAWVYGVKGMVRRLRSAIDDVCDTDVILTNAAKQGLDVDDLAPLKGCRIFNPGVANDYVLLTDEGSHETVHISNDDYGYPHLKRNYYSLEFKLEHPFDGKWYGSFSYLYSRSYGNTEGQVRTDVSQSDISATTSWDNPAIMVYSNGDQASDRRHQFKFNGYYQLTDEWLLGANVDISSGAPKSCLGSFGFDNSNPDPQSYGYSAYYFCNHKPEPPGRAGRLPWQWDLSASVEYRPAWAGKKLAFDLYAFNLLNQQRPKLLDYGWGSTGAEPTSSYDRVIYRQDPRYVRLSLSYDF